MTARVLIIAGSDSGGGAGIQADIKTVTMLGGHAMTAITAITAQNTLGVQGVHAVPTEMVLAQIESVVSDIGVDAIKIGMIGAAETAMAVAQRLTQDDLATIPVIFDPVMVATSGAALADAATIAAFAALMRRATLVTPNLPELEALANRSVKDEVTLQEAVDAIVERMGCPAVLAKGGHLTLQGEVRGSTDAGAPYVQNCSDLVFDFLYVNGPDGYQEWVWHDPRIDTLHTHGTGCTLASGIATGLAQGLPMAEAIARARQFVRAALLAAPGFGSGHGPMGHAAVDMSKL